MKARLIYTNEISGELDVKDEIEHMNEQLASILMDEILDKQQSRVNSFIFLVHPGEMVTVRAYKWIKDGKRYSLYKLVGMELE